MSEPPVEVTWSVEHGRIVNYLLSTTHKKGASKAKYLLAFGFRADDPEALSLTLVKHALAHLPGVTMLPEMGPRRVIFEGEVSAPDGRQMRLRTVWEFTTPTELRLLTAIPLTR